MGVAAQIVVSWFSSIELRNKAVAYLKFGKDYPAGVIVYKNMIPVVGSDQLVK